MRPIWESGLSEGPDSLIKRVSEPGGTDGSIVFLGHFISRDAMTLAEIQALWAVAYMNGKLQKKTQKEMEEDVALVIAWRRRRYLGDGHTYLFDGHEVSTFVFEVKRRQRG
jgi:hypothetical protein